MHVHPDELFDFAKRFDAKYLNTLKRGKRFLVKMMPDAISFFPDAHRSQAQLDRPSDKKTLLRVCEKFSHSATEQEGFNTNRYRQITVNASYILTLIHLYLRAEVEEFKSPGELPKTYYVPAGEMVLVNRYERDPQARKKCIAHYGAKCIICCFDFGRVYGEEVTGFIHVHHLKWLSRPGGTKYQLDPIRDLRPVCPNCHAVLHYRRGKPYELEQVRSLIQYNKPVN
jgi:hypothetical protein